MKLHSNARLTPKSRAAMAREVIAGRLTLLAAAQSYRVSEATVKKWVSRFKTEGVKGMGDRSSRPHRPRAQTPASVLKQIEALRRARMTCARIAERTGVSKTTVSRVLKRLGLSRLSRLDPEEPARRYERESPGELLHLDTKKLGRILRTGHRATGDRASRVRGAGWETVFVAVDDHSRLAFAEMADDETIPQALQFLRHAIAHYARMGVRVDRIMTDNGSAFRSKAFAALVAELGLRHVFTRPYTPRTNGKAERFIQSALREWAYGFAYRNSAQRCGMLDHWLHHYNWHRPHAGIGAQPPITRLPIRPHNLLTLHS